MMRRIKNLLEGRMKEVDESLFSFRYRVSFGAPIDWTKRPDERLSKGLIVPELWAAETCADIPPALLRYYKSRMINGININSGYRILAGLGCPPIGDYEEKFKGRKLKHASVDEAIKIIQEAEDSGHSPHLINTWYPVQQHQVFEGREDERHYLDLHFEFVEKRINALGRVHHDTMLYPRYVTIDFLVGKEDK